MDFSGIHVDLTAVLGLLATIVTGLFTLLATWLKKKLDSDTNRSKAELAGLRVAALVTALAGRAWDRLSPKLQAALADGKITPDERLSIEKEIEVILGEFTTADNLKEMAGALGLPMAGLIAKIASMLISTFTSAHDPDLMNSPSPLGFPVRSVEV